MNVGTMTIKSRRSVRKYKSTAIPAYVLQDVLDCGRLAPTAENVQPWLFGAVTDKELLRRIAALAENAPFIADAAACIAVFGRPEEPYYLEDCAAATMNMIIALQSLGYGSCWVAGEKKPYADAVRELLSVPARYSLVALIAAGEPAEIANPPKKRLDEVSFLNRYGEAGTGPTGS